jgi:hypothetical protein
VKEPLPLKVSVPFVGCATAVAESGLFSGSLA